MFSSGQAAHLHLKDKDHSVKDRVKSYLLQYCAVLSPNTHSHPGGNSPLPPGTSDSNVSLDDPPPFNGFYGPLRALTAILETNSQPPIFKIWKSIFTNSSTYTKATLFPVENHELYDKNKAVSYCYDWPMINQFTDFPVWRYLGIASSNMNFLSRVWFDTISYICIQEGICSIAIYLLFQSISLSNPFRYFFF